MSLLQRLKQRKIVQWGIAYLCGAWVFVEATNLVVEQFSWPQIVGQVVTILAFFGFFVALVLAWYHGEKGRQRVSGPELLMVAALLVVAGVALTMLGGEEEVAGPAGTVATAAHDDERPSIAVLPFEDHSPNPEDSWFADGVQEDITTALSRISSISVRGQSSVDRYREDRPPVREIAGALGVDYLLEGSGGIIGSQVRVTVQLIDGNADDHLWTEVFDRPFSMDAATLLWSEISQGVAAAVGARIAPAEQAALATLPTEDPEAYRLIHQARVLWNRRKVPEIRTAIGLYEEAIELDPGYGDAFAGLGEACLYLGILSSDRQEAIEGFERAVASALRALEIDPTAGGPHAVLGGVELWQRANFEGAELEFKEAIRLAPDHAFAHYWYALLLSAIERHEEAFQQLSIALRLDPLAQAMSHGQAKLYFQARDYPRAVEEGLEAAEIYPDYNPTKNFLCDSYLMLRQFDAAREWCEAASPEGEGRILRIGLYHAVRGDREAALREVERAQEVGGDWAGALRYQIPATLGEIDEAIRELRHYIDISGHPPIRLRVDPFVDSLRGDPRFIQILRDVGLEG